MNATAKPLPALTLRSVTSTAVEVPLRYVLGTSAATVRAAPLLLVDDQRGGASLATGGATTGSRVTSSR